MSVIIRTSLPTYYNDNDEYCCQWLRNLISAGHLPPGEVDSRSITDVSPEDLKGFGSAHFFAGLGGWPYALRLSQWPDDRVVWTGSCPCQPFSVAGRRKGLKDPRHLWPFWLRLIDVVRPPVLFGEQVAAAADWLSGVRGDLEAMDYALGCLPIEAACAGAAQYRDRIWIVALSHNPQRWADSPARDFNYRTQTRRYEDPSHPAERSPGSLACDDGQHQGHGNLQRRREFGRTSSDSEDSAGSMACSPQQFEYRPGSSGKGRWPEHSNLRIACLSDGTQFIECPDGKFRRLPPPRVRWLGNGIPARVARLRALGNSIYPPVAAEFISAYLETESEMEAEVNG